MCMCMCACVCVHACRTCAVGLVHHCEPCTHETLAKSHAAVGAFREEPQERWAVNPDGDAQDHRAGRAEQEERAADVCCSPTHQGNATRENHCLCAEGVLLWSNNFPIHPY